MKTFLIRFLIIILLLELVLNKNKHQKNKNKKTAKTKQQKEEKTKQQKETKIKQSKEIKSKKKQRKHSKKIEDIPKLMKWATKNNIYINPNLIINKNTDNTHHFYYFTSNATIPNNTVLLKVPYDMMFSQNYLNNFLKKDKDKFANLWEKILKIDNEFISYFSTKQLFYVSIIIENSINKKKGSVYKKYKPYFKMYEYMDMDHFPIFYGKDEIYFLGISSFGDQLTKAVNSLKEEYYIINFKLNITNSIQDSFFKYRVLSLANSLNFNNTNLNNNKFNETVVIPFIDFFNKAILSHKDNAKYEFKKDENNNYYFEIVTTKNIKSNSEIYLKWIKFPNNECLLYYGFIEKENMLAPKYYIQVFNNVFKKDLGININETFKGVIKHFRYEINTQFFDPENIESYRNLSKLFDKYKGKKEGLYEMMADNLQYYLNIYKERLSEGNINLYIMGEEKRHNIKNVLGIEELLLKKKMKYLKTVIQDIKENKVPDL